MSKELNALNNLKDFVKSECVEDEYQEDIDIIETALKDYEELKRFKIRTLTNDEIKQLMEEHSVIIEPYEGIPIDINLPKKLKALEIISQNFKLVGNCLHAKNKYAKNGWVFVKEIEDEEEYDLLKEMLK